MLDSIKQKLEKLNPIESTSLKKAGVFIGILYHDEYINNPEIIFTQRSTKLSTHSGEVSFPGGKWDEQDKNLYETALRESNEEINPPPPTHTHTRPPLQDFPKPTGWPSRPGARLWTTARTAGTKPPP